MNQTLDEKAILEELECLHFENEEQVSEASQDALNEIGAIEAEFYSPEISSSIYHTMSQWKRITGIDPGLSGNDIDAFWQGADFDGSETSGGSSPTPGQDMVDDLAKPWGISYSPEEELDILKKINKLEDDRRKWEGWDDRS